MVGDRIRRKKMIGIQGEIKIDFRGFMDFKISEKEEYEKMIAKQKWFDTIGSWFYKNNALQKQ